MTPTVVFDTYWRFAAERLAMFYRRYGEPAGPWTSDSILRSYRFTNVYRAADRVSQYLIAEVQARQDRFGPLNGTGSIWRRSTKPLKNCG